MLPGLQCVLLISHIYNPYYITYLKTKRKIYLKKVNSAYMYKCSIMTTPHASKMIADSIKCVMIRLLVPMGNIS